MRLHLFTTTRVIHSQSWNKASKSSIQNPEEEQQTTTNQSYSQTKTINKAGPADREQEEQPSGKGEENLSSLSRAGTTWSVDRIRWGVGRTWCRCQKQGEGVQTPRTRGNGSNGLWILKLSQVRGSFICLKTDDRFEKQQIMLIKWVFQFFEVSISHFDLFVDFFLLLISCCFQRFFSECRSMRSFSGCSPEVKVVHRWGPCDEDELLNVKPVFNGKYSWKSPSSEKRTDDVSVLRGLMAFLSHTQSLREEQPKRWQTAAQHHKKKEEVPGLQPALQSGQTDATWMPFTVQSCRKRKRTVREKWKLQR